MAEILSALAGQIAAARHGVAKASPGVRLEEVKGRDLVQVGAWPETVASVAGELAAAIGSPAPAPRGGAVSSGGVTAFFVGPDKIWVTAPLADGLERVQFEQNQEPAPDSLLGARSYGEPVSTSPERALAAKLGKLWPSSKAVVTELGHSRTIIRIGGPNARDLIARFLSLDTDPALFAAGGVASAGLHGIGVTLHHVTDGSYDLYLPRSFALSVTEALVEVAEQWGCEVGR